VQFLRPAQQVKGIQKAYQAKVMVAVKMGNKNMADPLEPYAGFAKLHLGSFTAIEQEKAVSHLDQMSRGIAVGCRYRGTGAKNGYREGHIQRYEKEKGTPSHGMESLNKKNISAG